MVVEGTPVGAGGTVHFTTITLFEKKLAKVAADNNLDFSAEETVIYTRRLENAYNIILGALRSRGLSVANVNLWARGEEFQLDIATYWYGRDAGWGSKGDDEKDWVKVFDREEELATVSILDTSGNVLSKGGGIAAEGINLLDANAALGHLP